MKSADKFDTWDALAVALEVDRSTLYRWRHFPDAPADKLLSAWRKFMATMPSRSPRGEESRSLRTARLTQEIRALRLHSDRREGVLVAEAKQTAADILVEAGKSLRHALASVPAALAAAAAGKTADQLTGLIRDLIEQALIDARLPERA